MEESFKKCIFYLNNFECILLFQKLENMVKNKNKKIKKKSGIHDPSWQLEKC